MAKIPTCYDCAYSYFDPGQWLVTVGTGWPSRPVCANHPESLGRTRPTPVGRVCRNYRPKPETPQGDVRQISVGEGLYTYVDAADYEWLRQWTWTLHSGYAVRYRKKKQLYMHREIMKPPAGMVVDHINRNKLDNTRGNLRVCTHRENAANRGKRRGSASRFLGVGWDKRYEKWCGYLPTDGKPIWLGYFDDEGEAAREYDRKAVERLGPSARLNFPEEWPPEKIQQVHEKQPAKKGKNTSTKRPPRTRGTAGKRSDHGQSLPPV